jgi:hypothetical protein
MKYRRGYEPKSSQTRYGQAVDNPPIRLDDTARLRTILLDHSSEWHEAVAEVQRVQSVHTDRWQAHFRKEKDIASKEDIHTIWKALAVIGAVALSLFGWLLTKVHT